jgi:hypothetical protein
VVLCVHECVSVTTLTATVYISKTRLILWCFHIDSVTFVENALYRFD